MFLGREEIDLHVNFNIINYTWYAFHYHLCHTKYRVLMLNVQFNVLPYKKITKQIIYRLP